MLDTKTPDVEVFIHMTLINGKFDVEYHATPNHVAMVNFALSMAGTRVWREWEKMDPKNAECGATSISEWVMKQIAAKRAGGASC